MKYPEYSVLMTVYYKEKPEWLKESIKCAFNQSVKPTEFVLVEDGPLTEDLYKVIEEFRTLNPGKFRVIKLPTNKGSGPASREGVEACKCEYIARLDSDDLCDPDRMKKELDKFLEDPTLDLVGSNVTEFNGDRENVVSRVILPETPEQILEYSKKRMPLRHSGIMFKKEACLRAGNYREYHLVEDYDICNRMLRCGSRMYNIQEFLTFMRVNDNYYKRRGGIKYLKSMYKFKHEQYEVGYISYVQFLKSFVPHAVVCLLPNSLRDLVYKKLLRK